MNQTQGFFEIINIEKNAYYLIEILGEILGKINLPQLIIEQFVCSTKQTNILSAQCFANCRCAL